MDRRELVGGSTMALALLMKPAWANAVPVDASDCIVTTREGRLRGVRSGGLDVYRGVRYAEPASGAARFRAAAPLTPWSGVRDAIRLGAPSLQPSGGVYGLGEPAPDEDCLFLNIWAPTGGKPGKPVMVYSHGGGFMTGSGGSVLADGGNLARENDVVVVATNHRLGLLGFLYLDELGGEEYWGSGNRGVQDIAVALAWVARNVDAFGGDPGNVMIFGESGGGAKTNCLYAMPQAAPFFHKASNESGPAVRIMTPDKAAETTHRVLAELGIEPASWRSLLDVPATRLLAAQMKVGNLPNAMPLVWKNPLQLTSGKPGEFGAVIDGHVMPHHPFDPAAPDISRDKPLMTGGNRDEQMFFSLIAGDVGAWTMDEPELIRRMTAAFGSDAATLIATYRGDRPGATPADLFFAIQSDLFSLQGSTVIAERKARQARAKVYRYIFAFESQVPIPGTTARMGAMHGLDIAFKFNNMNARINGSPRPFTGTRPERYVVGGSMSRLWAGFARTGVPHAEGVPAWPAYKVDRRATMTIDATCSVVDDPHAAERRYWAPRI